MRYAIGLLLTLTGLLASFGPHPGLALGPRVILMVLGVAVGGAMVGARGQALHGVRGLFREAGAEPLRQGLQLLRSLRMGALAGGFLVMSFGFVAAMRHVEDPALMRSNLLMTVAGLFWGLFIGVILMTAKMDDPRAIGASMSILLLTQVYSLLLAFGIVRPLASSLASRLEDTDG